MDPTTTLIALVFGLASIGIHKTVDTVKKVDHKIVQIFHKHNKPTNNK